MESQKLSNLRVLCVDDDPLMLKVFATSLANMGVAHVSTEKSARDALKWIEGNQQAIDVVLCDLNMPDMNGVELLDAFSRLGYEGAVIVISGANEVVVELSEKLAKAKGVNLIGSLTKPVNPADLKPLLEQVLP